MEEFINTRKISLSGVYLTPVDLAALASVISHCDHLSTLELINCHLDKRCLEALANGLKNSQVKIDVLDVSFNPNLRKDSLAHLYEICQRTQGLNYWQCGFRQIDLLNFNPELPVSSTESEETSEEDIITGKFKREKILDLSQQNVENHSDCFRKLASASSGEQENITAILSGYSSTEAFAIACDVIRECVGIVQVAVCECALTESAVEILHDSLAEKEVSELNIFLNDSIDDGGWDFIGRIICKCEVESLFITACHLTESKLQQLGRYADQFKLRKLNLSRSEMSERTIRVIAGIVVKCHVKELIMGYCNLTTNDLRIFKESLGKAKLERFDVSGNYKMTADGYSILAEIVINCEVEQLDISECDPSPEDVRLFKESLCAPEKRLKKLNVSRNRRMNETGLQDIGALSADCQLQELFIRQCDLEINTLKSLSIGLGDYQIPVLDLGYYFMSDRETTTEEVKFITHLLKNVSSNLTLNKWKVGVRERELLQKAMDSEPYRALSIQFNRSIGNVMKQSNVG